MEWSIEMTGTNETIGTFHCELCNGSGIVQAQNATGALYAFNCNCSLGQLQRRHFPRFSNRHAADYRVLAVDDIMSAETHLKARVYPLVSVPAPMPSPAQVSAAAQAEAKAIQGRSTEGVETALASELPW